MTCCVPKCNTSYWKKSTRKITMFTASTERQLEEWREILQREVDLPNMQKKDRICILHFREDVIERERTLFLPRGEHRKVARKIPILSPYATPSIFHENSYASPKTKKKSKFYDIVSPEILAQQRKIFQEFKMKVNRTDNPKKVKKQVQLVKRNFESIAEVKNEIEDKEPVKRKLEGVDDVATAEVKTEKQQNINELYDHILNAIHEKKNVSKYLTKVWIPNFHDGGCVSWTLWKEDCSGYSKRIVLHNDLKVDCYLDGKSIFLPEMSKIENMCDFEKLTRTVSDMKICMDVEGDLGWE